MSEDTKWLSYRDTLPCLAPRAHLQDPVICKDFISKFIFFVPVHAYHVVRLIWARAIALLALPKLPTSYKKDRNFLRDLATPIVVTRIFCSSLALGTAQGPPGSVAEPAPQPLGQAASGAGVAPGVPRAPATVSWNIKCHYCKEVNIQSFDQLRFWRHQNSFKRQNRGRVKRSIF